MFYLVLKCNFRCVQFETHPELVDSFNNVNTEEYTAMVVSLKGLMEARQGGGAAEAGHELRREPL